MRVRGLVISLVFLLLGAAPAMATTRYAAPGSPNVSGGCAVASNPCALVYAFNTATGPGDELVLAPGDYGSASSPLTTPLDNGYVNVSVHAQPGRRARIFESAPPGTGPGLELGDPTDSLRDVEVVHRGLSGGWAVFVAGRAERVIGRSSNGSGCYAGIVLIDSLCVGVAGIEQANNASSPETDNLTMRNVTAIGTAGPGIRFVVSGDLTTNVNAVNVIARGTVGDVEAISVDPSSSVRLTFGYSNYARIATSGNSAVIQSPVDTNQTAPPVFANAAADDFHQAPMSPTIDHGISNPANGSLDVDGLARTQGVSTDIGSYESLPSGATSQPPGRTPGAQGAPALSSLSVSPKKQSVAGRKVKSRCVAPNKKNNADKHCQRLAQLTIRYTLSAATNVTFTLYRQTIGRKVNGKCVKQTKKNQKHKKCTRYPTLASVTRSAEAGTDSFAVNGKLFGAKLAPGAYVLRAQLSGGTARNVSFTIKS